MATVSLPVMLVVETTADAAATLPSTSFASAAGLSSVVEGDQLAVHRPASPVLSVWGNLHGRGEEAAQQDPRHTHMGRVWGKEATVLISSRRSSTPGRPKR